MEHEITKQLAEKLKEIKLDREIRIMEICGTHTTEFFRTGVKDIFPEGLILIDGPGCPVCVTTNDYLDRAIEIGKVHNPIITTFGDMIKVPSSYSSLAHEKSSGMDIRIVYSPINALHIAKDNPDREVMFLSVGFETTAPTEAVAVKEAMEKNIQNFSILACNKLTPPAVDALLSSDEVHIDGFIIPGHVSAVIGSEAWNFIATKHNRPGVVAGFETSDLISGVLTLLKLLETNDIIIKNVYNRVVHAKGNQHAIDIIHEVFDESDANWRGIGIIPASGLTLRDKYAAYDAENKFPVTPPEPKEHKGCRCGDLLRGLILPVDCPLFGNGCTPEHAIGPCMVSSEGPCSAYYKYWRK